MQNFILHYSCVDIVLAFTIIGVIMKFVERALNIINLWRKSKLELESMKLDNKKKRLEIKQYKKKINRI